MTTHRARPRPTATDRRQPLRASTARAVVLMLVGVTAWASPLPAAAAGGTCGPGVGGDVNGDGHAETLVGQPFGARPSSVHLFYGHRDGLVADARGSALDDQVISQATPGVPGTDDGQSGFGISSVLADLNGDGCADLAVGAPDSGAGSVVVLYGSRRGVTSAGAQRFTLDSLFGVGAGTRGQQFGYDLSAGDLNGD